MSAFPNGIETRADAIRLLKIIDGQEGGELGEWDVDDFSSISSDDPVLEACRLRLRDELIDMLASSDASRRDAIKPLVAEMIEDLQQNA